ncbi:hypothetical protein [Leeuwenhoekiella nanhaiensis]|uniref:HEPN AbiU2-like domain-containing protein n=1 Tax=Leeuwenhoekiella nanhaiensis TaxID=1655491 RepID=A0A2G1VU94_9FLAO|nr:hypothetical protein [Leeuwenhoekiella nanhaiensis]PHQ30314.1 hypothetical protein CJ305_04950 [Leeuwenhoekiella nanhaiensis]
MYTSKDILFHIKHYENELTESYQLLGFLESGAVKGNTSVAQSSIEEVIKHIKFICFFTSCFLDIASSLRGLVDCDTHWERKFYLKNGFVVIYESVKTFGKHQKEIHSLIKSDFPQLEHRYKVITQNLRKLKKEHKYDKIIATFRNKAGAHYDENFEAYFENLKLIDKPISVKTLSDFANFLMSLIVFWSDLIDIFNNKTEKDMRAAKEKISGNDVTVITADLTNSESNENC